jgi:hypothetical protein
LPRRIHWGTPGRSKHYLQPRRAYVLVLPALGLGALAVAALLGGHFAGLRGPVSPGSLISAHAAVESRCQECHAPRSGASNFRCQRCHDPAGAGRLANAAHVLFGSRDAKKAGAAPNLACARCHVEHRGRASELATVDQAHCVGCHFRGLPAHPEFAVLRSPTRELPGLRFGHARHVQELVKQQGIAERETCLRCHELTPPTRGRDLEPVGFDRHCASCHAREGSIGVVDPVPVEDALPLAEIAALGVKGEWLQREQEFETGRGKVGKTTVVHRDPWVLWSLSRLRREVEPAAHAAERGALLARLSQLRRRLVLAEPLASLEKDGLEQRAAALDLEILGLETRLAAQAGAADAGSGLSRIEEVAAAAQASRESAALGESARLRSEAQPLLGKPVAGAALPAEDFEERRRELLAALDAVESADAELRPRAEDLRRRLLALTPGDTGGALLARALEQRRAERERVADEVRLRDAGSGPPAAALLLSQQRLIQEAIQQTQVRLDEIGSAPGPKREPTPDELERKQESLEIVASPCTKCHVLAGGALARVAAARPVLVRGRFVHQPHLQAEADCLRCHPGVDKSKASQDLNLAGIELCRECHRMGAVRQDCQACHRYHPPAVP